MTATMAPVAVAAVVTATAIVAAVIAAGTSRPSFDDAGRCDGGGDSGGGLLPPCPPRLRWPLQAVVEMVAPVPRL